MKKIRNFWQYLRDGGEYALEINIPEELLYLVGVGLVFFIVRAIV